MFSMVAIQDFEGVAVKDGDDGVEAAERGCRNSHGRTATRQAMTGNVAVTIKARVLFGTEPSLHLREEDNHRVA